MNSSKSSTGRSLTLFYGPQDYLLPNLYHHQHVNSSQCCTRPEGEIKLKWSPSSFWLPRTAYCSFCFLNNILGWLLLLYFFQGEFFNNTRRSLSPFYSPQDFFAIFTTTNMSTQAKTPVFRYFPANVCEWTHGSLSDDAGRLSFVDGAHVRRNSIVLLFDTTRTRNELSTLANAILKQYRLCSKQR